MARFARKKYCIAMSSGTWAKRVLSAPKVNSSLGSNPGPGAGKGHTPAMAYATINVCNLSK